jgi:hypothetical protein
LAKEKDDKLDRERFAALGRKAKALQKVWLREREERRAM